MTSPARQLRAEAAQAAETRDALTHPDVVALKVERTRALVDRLMWAAILLGLAFTMVNVQQFAARTIGAGPGSLEWWAAWLLDPTIAAGLLGILIAERRVAPGRIVLEPVAQVAKWALLSATYVMNTWASYAAGSLAGVVLHSVPPVVVFVLAEVMPGLHDKLTEYVDWAAARAAERADRTRTVLPTPDGLDRPVPPSGVGSIQGMTERTACPVHPIPPAPERLSPAVQTAAPTGVDSLPRTVPATGPKPVQSGPLGRSASRPGSTSRTGSAGSPDRSDEQLAEQVRELAQRSDGPPTVYAVRQALGVGHKRAARLLAQLDEPTPADRKVS